MCYTVFSANCRCLLMLFLDVSILFGGGSLCAPQVIILTEVSSFITELSDMLPNSLVYQCLEDNGTFVANV
jgi:hypothetical protein